MITASFMRYFANTDRHMHLHKTIFCLTMMGDKYTVYQSITVLNLGCGRLLCSLYISVCIIFISLNKCGIFIFIFYCNNLHPDREEIVLSDKMKICHLISILFSFLWIIICLDTFYNILFSWQCSAFSPLILFFSIPL